MNKEEPLREENQRLRDKIHDLHRRLEEAEATVEAIRNGEVDALVVSAPEGEKVYTLQGADHPYRLLVESMQQGAATLNQDGTILFCNRYLADLLGQAPLRVAGASLLDFVAPSDQPACWNLLQVASARCVARGEIRLQRAEESSFPAELIIHLLPLQGQLCLIVTDLTRQKQYEELQRAQQALQEADRRKDEFLATLAHELRNPLATLRNSLGILGQKENGVRTSHPVHLMMERQLNHLVRLVDDLLDVSRITLDKIQLRKERLDVMDVVHSALETSRPLLQEGRHELTVTQPLQRLHIWGDFVRLAQVVANLLNNAARYTPGGGRIALQVERQGEQAAVSVRDNGIGIPREMLTEVFEMFTQVHTNLVRAQSGLGLGLSLVKSLVEMHGGTVEAHSDGPGQGSVFVVRLPLLAEEKERQSAGEPRASDRPAPATRRRILVVDDNKDSANSLGQLLEIVGHEVRTAYDGPSALTLAEALVPEVVLLDIGMPGMDGYEVASRMRQLPALQNTLLVAQTGWGQEEDLRRALEAGFHRHLVKPVDLAALQKVLATVPGS